MQRPRHDSRNTIRRVGVVCTGTFGYQRKLSRGRGVNRTKRDKTTLKVTPSGLEA
jgi:hypothetical protein